MPSRAWPSALETAVRAGQGCVLVVSAVRLLDRQAPAYNHGGGTVTYAGEQVIQPGAFKYKSPCPPGGVHTYVWTGKAKDENGDTISKAKANRKYPE